MPQVTKTISRCCLWWVDSKLSGKRLCPIWISCMTLEMMLSHVQRNSSGSYSTTRMCVHATPCLLPLLSYSNHYSVWFFSICQSLGIPIRPKIPEVPKIDWSKYSYTVDNISSIKNMRGTRGRKINVPEGNLNTGMRLMSAVRYYPSPIPLQSWLKQSLPSRPNR